jgi:hypothetical protein
MWTLHKLEGQEGRAGQGFIWQCSQVSPSESPLGGRVHLDEDPFRMPSHGACHIVHPLAMVVQNQGLDEKLLLRMAVWPDVRGCGSLSN